MFSFSLQNAHVPSKEQQEGFAGLKPTRDLLAEVTQLGGYDAPESSINLPSDSKILHAVKALAQKKMALNPSCMIVVGIGGSHLGTQAIYEALFGKQGNPEFPLYFADTVDADYIAGLLTTARHSLSKGQPILITLISKSGSTTETIANFECFLVLLKEYYPINYHEFVMVITDADSKLWKLAKEQQFDHLAIPALVGGRYSVMSAVGLFPLACTGVPIDQLCRGAQDSVAFCLDTDIQKNYAAASAIALAYHYKKGIKIHDFFVFSVALESVGKWYRQLMGESIGKEYTITGKQTHIGITPTVSVGSTDLHSVGQLYLGGPFDKYTTFVTVESNKHAVMVPSLPEYETLVPHIQATLLSAIMRAIFEGTAQAYKDGKRPFMQVQLAEKNAYWLGQLLQSSMIQMMYLGALLEVNPFDQPQVELYKTQTRKILAHE